MHRRLAKYDLTFGAELRILWLEYEAQESLESRWVRVLDRFMPFLVNLEARGRNWQQQSINRSQLLQVCQPTREYAPEIYSWMLVRIEGCGRRMAYRCVKDAHARSLETEGGSPGCGRLSGPVGRSLH